MEPPEYVVSYPLAREGVYQGLPLREREALHAAAGRALEGYHGVQHRERSAEACEELAYHYSQAGDARKAIEHLTRVADISFGASELAEAAEALAEALGHAARLPGAERDRRHVELLLRLTGVLGGLGRAREVLDLLRGERERVERLHDPRLTGRYHCQLALAHSYLGEPEPARAAGRRAVDEAARCGDEPIIGRATGFAYGIGLGERALGRIALAAGALEEAATRLEAARALFTRTLQRGQVLHSNISNIVPSEGTGPHAPPGAP